MTIKRRKTKKKSKNKSTNTASTGELSHDDVDDIIDEIKEDDVELELEAKRSTTVDKLHEIIHEGELFHDADQQVYARFWLHDHYQTFQIWKQDFKNFLTGRYYEVTKKVPNKEALESAINLSTGKGLYGTDECRQPFIRTAESDGRIYFDLGDDEKNGLKGQVVEIDKDGWRITQDHPICFIRAPGMRAVPVPKKPKDTKKGIERLRRHLNVDDDGFILAVAWLIQALRPKGPYPILALSGEHGSSKSTFSQILRSFIDPSKAPLRTMPTNERNLAVSCSNSWVVAFDNLSRVKSAISDALCRVSTGGGFSHRSLYTNDDEKIFAYQRPIILNGISDYITRNDLIDRTMMIELTPISEKKRKTESRIYSDLAKDVPYILGGLFDAISTALRRVGKTSLEKMPRLADFAIWVQAAEPALPWKRGKFQRVFERNRSLVIKDSLDSDIVGTAIVRYFGPGKKFKGNASELKNFLESNLSSEIINSVEYQHWPKNATGMGKRVNILAPFLRQFGISVLQHRRNVKGRGWTIKGPKKNESNAS